MFTTQRTVKLADTDATGVIYFTSQLRFAQEIFEEFLTANEKPLLTLLNEKKLYLPIVHTEADFLAPLFPGDELTVELAFSEIGKSSFRHKTNFIRLGQLVGHVEIVHVCVDASTRQKVEIPSWLSSKLSI